MVAKEMDKDLEVSEDDDTRRIREAISQSKLKLQKLDDFIESKSEAQV